MNALFALLLSAALLAGAPVAAQEKAGISSAGRASAAARGASQSNAGTYAVVAFHDVTDRVQDLDADAITTDRLIAFFDWLKGNGWTPVSLDDIAAAQTGARALPAKPILLTFDDGYASMYTRVLPLALAYRYPIVSALVGSWMDVPAGGMVKYGDETVPRARFLSWEQAREMQASGLVEFASHSFNLHEGVLANPQGNTLPSAVALRYSDNRPGETVTELQARIKADLERSRALMQRELGKAPRALVWPFGRYNEAGLAAAKSAGFAFAMSLEPAIGELAKPMAFARYWPSHNPTLADLVSNIAFKPSLPAAQRLVCVNPAQIWNADPAVFDANLGKAIERLRALGATTAVIDAGSVNAQGQLDGLWFPSSVLPTRANALSRIAWQMRTRGGVEAVARLPQAPAAVYEELGLQIPWDGFFVATDGTAPGNAQATDDFNRVAKGNPELRMIALVQNNNATSRASTPAADLTLYSPEQLAGRIAPEQSRKVGIWLEQSSPISAHALKQTTTDFQVRGGTAIGWCADDPVNDLPAAAVVAPAVSASTYPVRF